MGYPELKRKFSLKDAINFHGHLGPYLVLGLKAGSFALDRLKAKRYFDIEVNVFGLDKKPKSCIIDGLQLSTGATFGKGNIKKFKARNSRIEFLSPSNKDRLSLTFQEPLIKILQCANNHKSSEILARKIFKTNPRNLFKIKM